MESALKRAPAPQQRRAETGTEREWDPYLVWKRQITGSEAGGACEDGADEGVWSPYQVWASYVARKR